MKLLVTLTVTLCLAFSGLTFSVTEGGTKAYSVAGGTKGSPDVG